ncbi:class I adenylate-forming enzyme family protein [Nocardia sp. CA-107356]|uniref:class I adenylate-forming enzyme family protein n=1 Tax=Nocardia sp. CA-107356 TaxID=3239972 RepID=UPI003D8FB2E9
MNIAQLLVKGADAGPGNAAWVYGDAAASYTEVVDRVGRLAGGLHTLGLVAGDRVLIDVPNCPELVEMLWACFWGGFVAVPVNWHLHPDEVGYIASHSAVAAGFVAPQTEQVVGVLPLGTHVVSTEVLASGAAMAMWETSSDDPAWLFYTSGTTGRPKGATLTHRNLLAMTLNYYADVDPVAAGSTFLHAAPLTHGSGLYLLPSTGHGATNVIQKSKRFDPAEYLCLVERHRVTHGAFLAPTMLKRIVDAARGSSNDLASLRSIVVGGAPLYRDDLRAARQVLGPIVTQIYGQGEAPMTIAAMRAEETDESRLGSCGRTFTGVEVRVADGGEILVRGDVVMRGYWSDETSTARTLADGWLRTGDIGHLDEAGYLYLTDRAKDVIITGGSNVYPREVEEVLLTHPHIREVAVIGVPDSEWGESICAVVVPVSGHRPDGDELAAFCRRYLASFKKPRYVHIVSDLPKNATGKVLKQQLRALVAERMGVAFPE